jgi:EAL domain-containing protein (putative c-di-GMP-specific phosphodiesterase class I)
VETEAQREHLASLGCNEFQGWLYAPALPVAALQERLGWDPATPGASAWATLAA